MPGRIAPGYVLRIIVCDQITVDVELKIIKIARIICNFISDRRCVVKPEYDDYTVITGIGSADIVCAVVFDRYEE